MIVAGAGMAGLVAAARARELGLRPRVIEKGTRAGGSMLLSSGVVWRHREWEDFRSECPAGDAALQRLVWERLDDGLAWLESLGAEPVWTETGNPRTVGRRYDPRALTALLARDVELETPLPADAPSPLVLACGGFAKRLAEEQGLLLRANPWSDGAALDLARSRGAALSGGLDEFYGRALPAPPARIGEDDFVPLAQLYGRWARVFADDGRDVTPRVGVVVARTTSRRRSRGSRTDGPGTCWTRRRWRTATAAGRRPTWSRRRGRRAEPSSIRRSCRSRRRRRRGSRVHVAAAVTHTIGGLRIDTAARVLGEDGSPLDGLWAAGVDAGGVATGGYASGLAQALVLGLAAAESIAR